MLGKIFYQLLDVLAPARCVSCLWEETWLCWTCAVSLITFQQQCLVCKERQPRGLTCQRHKKAEVLAGVISAGAYSADYIRRSVHWLKFKGVRQLAPLMADLVALHLPLVAPQNVLQREAALVPIPLHPRRFRERGFNQSWDIAQALSHETGIPVFDGLRRPRATTSQAELPHALREENMADAFALVKLLPNKKYFLILDDVVTTGATLLAAAKVLKQNSPADVWGISVARG